MSPKAWVKIGETIGYDLETDTSHYATNRQEQAIRDYAKQQGYDTLRGFHWFLKREDWSYYNVLRIVSPDT